MKVKTRQRVAISSALAVLVLGGACGVFAQGIEVKNRQFVADPTLPFQRPIGTSVRTEVSPRWFEVLATDRTVRETLARWSKAAGWKHELVHWTLDRDHPIEGAADASQFGADFRSAVRKLLSSTEATDRPAQPCFYTNFVVRVISKAEFCDRSVSASAQ